MNRKQRQQEWDARCAEEDARLRAEGERPPEHIPKQRKDRIFVEVRPINRRVPVPTFEQVRSLVGVGGKFRTREVKEVYLLGNDCLTGPEDGVVCLSADLAKDISAQTEYDIYPMPVDFPTATPGMQSLFFCESACRQWFQEEETYLVDFDNNQVPWKKDGWSCMFTGPGPEEEDMFCVLFWSKPDKWEETLVGILPNLDRSLSRPIWRYPRFPSDRRRDDRKDSKTRILEALEAQQTLQKALSTPSSTSDVDDVKKLAWKLTDCLTALNATEIGLLRERLSEKARTAAKGGPA